MAEWCMLYLVHIRVATDQHLKCSVRHCRKAGPPSHTLMGFCKLLSSMLFISSKVKLTCDEGHTVQQHAPPYHCLSSYVLLQVWAAATVGLCIATQVAVSAEVHLAPKGCLQCTLFSHRSH